VQGNGLDLRNRHSHRRGPPRRRLPGRGRLFAHPTRRGSLNMNKLSTALLVLGTIVGAFGGARLHAADPVVSTIGLAMLAAGCLIVWLQARAHRSGAVSATTDARVFELIRSVPDKLQPILDQADQLTLDQIADRLAVLELDAFRPIADASPALLSRMG